MNLHHHPNLIKDYIRTENNFGLDIVYSHEKDLLETGGGLKQAIPLFIKEKFIILHNSDIYTHLDLNNMINFFHSFNDLPTAVLAVKNRLSSRYFLFNDQDQLVGHENQQQDKISLINSSQAFKRLAFSGIHIISQKLFKYFLMFEQDKFSIVDVYLKALYHHEEIYGYNMGNSYFQDVGTPERLAELEHYLGNL